MTDIISDAMTRVSWVPTISNTSAPTATELNAGQALELLITADGYAGSTSTDKVDNTALASNQNTNLVGRRSDTFTMTFKQQGKTNPPWTTFAGNPTGYLVRRSGVAFGTAWTTGQKITVIPVQAGYRDEKTPAKNELEKFSVEMVITGQVIDTAAVA